ncbi:MAG: prepilin-type N-terminal cleavage/methylation domain-containing protein [Desulfobacteraceae bacterium]|nr:prepilin-type N-terminal cleavage/methylation domain-containing protein [Desulfobacteraceae bacterium]
MRTLQNQKGFTLIELLVVIIIIGILSAVVVPKYISLIKDAEYATVQGMVGALNAAAAIQFVKNRLVKETGHDETPTVYNKVSTATILGTLLDPAFTGITNTDYPNWTIAADGVTFICHGKSKDWICTLTAETADNRGKVVITTAYAD